MGKLRGVLALEEVRMTKPHLTRERGKNGPRTRGRGWGTCRAEVPPEGRDRKACCSHSPLGDIVLQPRRDPMWFLPVAWFGEWGLGELWGRVWEYAGDVKQSLGGKCLLGGAFSGRMASR